jgi:enoyl-CoA hydratase
MDERVIGAINGWDLGGGYRIDLACDIRIAAERARLGQMEVRVGIMPGYGRSVRLTRIVGPGRARKMIYRGKFSKRRKR